MGEKLPQTRARARKSQGYQAARCVKKYMKMPPPFKKDVIKIARWLYVLSAIFNGSFWD